jgi:hypothetical protein
MKSVSCFKAKDFIAKEVLFYLALTLLVAYFLLQFNNYFIPAIENFERWIVTQKVKTVGIKNTLSIQSSY